MSICFASLCSDFRSQTRSSYEGSSKWLSRTRIHLNLLRRIHHDEAVCVKSSCSTLETAACLKSIGSNAQRTTCSKSSLANAQPRERASASLLNSISRLAILDVHPEMAPMFAAHAAPCDRHHWIWLFIRVEARGIICDMHLPARAEKSIRERIRHFLSFATQSRSRRQQLRVKRNPFNRCHPWSLASSIRVHSLLTSCHVGAYRTEALRGGGWLKQKFVSASQPHETAEHTGTEAVPRFPRKQKRPAEAGRFELN